MSATRVGQDGHGRRILIVGTGGQGVLTAARSLCECLVGNGHHVVSGQLHGMAQRGGCVQSSVLIDCGISPVIGSGRADFVLGFEPVETARAVPYASSRTVVFMNTAPVIPYVLGQRAIAGEDGAQYPDVEALAEAIRLVTPHIYPFDATQRAVEAGSARALNMVMLGCLLGTGMLPCSADGFWNAVEPGMPPAFRESNRRALSAGAELGREFGRCGERP